MRSYLQMACMKMMRSIMSLINLCELLLIDWYEGLKGECASHYLMKWDTFNFSVAFNNDFQLLKCDRKEVQDCHAVLIFQLTVFNTGSRISNFIH